MQVYTIGFTQKSAAQFFGLLKSAGIQRLIDVRLNNSSQLAAFAKKEDLAFFLKEICSSEYVHEPLLAPNQDMLDEYKKNKGSWLEYERRFLQLMQERKIERTLSKSMFDRPCVLLCSEASAEQCHRRLVAEYLQRAWGELEITHL